MTAPPAHRRADTPTAHTTARCRAAPNIAKLAAVTATASPTA